MEGRSYRRNQAQLFSAWEWRTFPTEDVPGGNHDIKIKLYGINYQIVAAPVNCSKLVVTIATRSARVLEGTETGQRLTVE